MTLLPRKVGLNRTYKSGDKLIKGSHMITLWLRHLELKGKSMHIGLPSCGL